MCYSGKCPHEDFRGECKQPGGIYPCEVKDDDDDEKWQGEVDDDCEGEETSDPKDKKDAVDEKS